MPLLNGPGDTAGAHHFQPLYAGRYSRYPGRPTLSLLLFNAPRTTVSARCFGISTQTAAATVLTGLPFPCRGQTGPPSPPPTTTLSLPHRSFQPPPDIYAASTRAVHRPRLRRRTSMGYYSVNHRAQREKRSFHCHGHCRQLLRLTLLHYHRLNRRPCTVIPLPSANTTPITGSRSELSTPPIKTTHCVSPYHRAPTMFPPHRPRPTCHHHLALEAS